MGRAPPTIVATGDGFGVADGDGSGQGPCDPRGSATAPGPEIAEGAVIGRYVVLGRVGAGATGVVLSAFDPELDRKVALKVLHAAAGDGDRARLQREAQALARLSHPNVMVVHDVGTWTDPSGGRHVFLAMELVEGHTLSDWLAASPRSPSAILAVFVDAGRGLAAAHAAGLVHRDFKPHNVLVGADGRVRVTDFGLARAWAEDGVVSVRRADTEPIIATDSHLDSTLTRSGVWVGTPAYMAPEQFEGQPPDPRADQFSFCVALYEALWGKRPFAGRVPGAIYESIRSGRIAAPPGRRGVPAPVRRAVVRGLALDPAARHSSMDALLVALRRRRRPSARVLGLALFGITGVGLLVGTPEKHDWCDGVAERMHDVWGSTRRQVIEARLRTVSAVRGESVWVEDVWDKVVPDLDARADAWVSAQREACALQSESPALAARRMACLHRRLEAMRSYTDLLADADGGIMAHAVEGLDGLGRAEDCTAMGIGPGPATDVADEARLHLTAELSRIDVLGDLGRYHDAVETARRARASAVTLGDRWLEAEAIYGLARTLEDDGHPDEAEQAYHDAFAVAVAAAHEEVVARAAISVAVLVAHGERHEDATRWIGHAEAAIERMGEGRRAFVPQLYNARGRVAHLSGDFEAAREAFDQAYRSRAEILGEDDVALASYLVNLGHSLAELGRLDESVAATRRAAELEERGYGASHPRLATTLTALCGTLSALDRIDEAVEACTRAREILVATVGETHPRMGTTLSNLGNAYGRGGHYALAIEAYEAARRNAEAVFGPDDARTALVDNNLGVLHELRGEYALALADHRRALVIFARALGEDHPRTSVVRMNLGSVLSKLERWGEAEITVRRAIEGLERRLGTEHPDVALALGMLAETYLQRARPAEAVALLERARTILAGAEGHARQVAQTDFALGAALWESGIDRPHARELVQRARAAFVALDNAGTDDVGELDAWLAAHTTDADGDPR